MSVQLEIKYATNIASGVKIDFPLIEEVASNKLVLQGSFYYSVLHKTNGWYEPIKIGKIGEITENKTLEELKTDYNTRHTAVTLLFKFDDDSKNTTEYNNKIFYTLGTAQKNFILNELEYTQFNGYFIVLNSSGDDISQNTYANTITNIDSDIDSTIETPTDTPTDTPTEEITDINIDVTLFDGFTSPIKSDIELFYCEVDTNNNNLDIISLGKFRDLESNILSLTYKSNNQGIKLFYKYVNENLNNSTYDNSLFIYSTLDYSSIYATFENNYFYFDKIINDSNYTIKEKIYNAHILPIVENNFISNIDVLDVSQYPQQIILTCNDGYFFNDTPTFTIQLTGGMGSRVETFTLSTDSKTATYEYNLNTGYYIKSFTAQTEKETVISENYGLVTLYKPSNDVLKNIANIKLYEYGTNKTLIDLSKYIISILSIPLDIETIDTKNIILNSIDTGITSDYINNNIIMLDMGIVDIQGFYNNSLDFTHTEIDIYLAFIGIQKLDISKYMNKTVNLKYKIDLFTGDCLAMLIVDNIIIDSFNGNIAIEIPYITNSDKTKNVNNYKNNNMLDDKISKIIITSNNINNSKIKDTKLYKDNLSDLQGFNVIEDFNSNDNLLKVDYDNIVSLLSQGVFF